MDRTRCSVCHNTKVPVFKTGVCHSCQKTLLETFEKQVNAIPAELRKERELFIARIETKPRLRIEEK